MNRLLHISTIKDYDSDIRKFPNRSMDFLHDLVIEQDKQTYIWMIDRVADIAYRCRLKGNSGNCEVIGCHGHPFTQSCELWLRVKQSLGIVLEYCSDIPPIKPDTRLTVEF